MTLSLGLPVSDYQHRGTLLWRHFDNGVAYVNVGAAPVSTKLPAGLVPFTNGASGPATRAGQGLTLGATSAALLLSERYLHPGRAAPDQPG